MGVIKQINSFDLVISLPNHLTGYVPVDAISLALQAQPTDLTTLPYYAVGQFVVCRVTQVESDKGRKRIQLSLLVPEDPPADLTVGQLVPVEVVAVEEKGYVVRLSRKAGDRVAFLKKQPNATVEFVTGQTVLATIASVQARTVQLSSGDLAGALLKDATILTVGSRVEGQLVEKQEACWLVQAGPHAIRIEGPEQPAAAGETEPGQRLAFRVIAQTGDYFLGSCRPDILALQPPTRLLGSPMPVELIDAQVVKVDQRVGLTLKATDNDSLCCFVHISRISDEHVSKIPSTLRAGKLASLRIIDRDPWANQWQATMQASLLRAPLLAYEQITPGMLVKGVVKRKLAAGGVIVAITEHLQALCPLLQLAETAGACSSLQERLQEGQPLRWRVLEVDATQKKLVVTRKRGLLDSELPAYWQRSQLKPDLWADGQIVSLGKSYGAMVRFYGQLKGLLPLGEMTDTFEKDPLAQAGLFTGQVVRVRIVKCEGDKLILSLRKSGGAKHKEENVDGQEKALLEKKKVDKKEKKIAVAESEAKKDLQAEVTSTPSEEKRGKMIEKKEESKKRPVETNTTEVKKNKLTLDDFVEDDDDAKEEEKVENVAKSKPTIEDVPNLAEVSDEFQRRLISQPNSSLLWIQWMSTLLRAGELAAARGVAERALTTISQREDQERLNVWIALLNLENRLGDEQSRKRVFERACVACDPLVIHQQLANLLGGRVAEDRQAGLNTRDSPSYSALTNLWQQMRKKWPGSGKMWLGQAQQLYSLGLVTEARQLQPTALKALPTRKHLKTVCRWAQLEYGHGSSERARTIFEGLLAQHPRRLDLWSIYLTMEENLIKRQATEDLSTLRRIYERCLAAKLSTKKARSLFKRWLEFEREHGDETGVQQVKTLAQRYVESLSQ